MTVPLEHWPLGNDIGAGRNVFLLDNYRIDLTPRAGPVLALA